MPSKTSHRDVREPTRDDVELLDLDGGATPQVRAPSPEHIRPRQTDQPYPTSLL